MRAKKPVKLFRSTFILLLLIVSSGWISNIYAQDSNKLVKANNLYKAKRYAEAIPIYETILEQDLNKSALLKLGRSHRQINNIKEALDAYKVLMQQPEVKPDHQLEFVELLIMNGDFLEARKNLQSINSTQSTINDIFRLTSMINNNLDMQPLYEDVVVESFMFNNPLSDENSPYLLEDKILFTSDMSQVSSIKKKSGLTGRAYYKVWEAEKVGDTYVSPKMLGNKINATGKNVANAYLSADSQEIYYTKNDNTKDRKDFYNMQLFGAKYSKGKFSKVEKLPFNTSEYNFMHPCISKDGKMLLFVSDRPGEGGTDIFYSRLTKNGWSRSKNLGDIINTKENEGFPFLDDEGNLYFCSKGHSGLGGYDIFLAKKKQDGSWDKPVNLGSPFNSQHDDISIFFKKNGKEGAFTSARNGSDDIFLFRIKS